MFLINERVGVLGVDLFMLGVVVKIEWYTGVESLLLHVPSPNHVTVNYQMLISDGGDAFPACAQLIR